MNAWPLRIAGWFVGIYALLSLAKSAGTLNYNKVFLASMDQLRGIADLGFLLKPLEQTVILPALDFVRSPDIAIPPLQDHWQQFFVLTWLLASATARNYTHSVSTPVALLAAFIVTLPFGVAAGTLPLRSDTIVLLPFAALVAFLALAAVFRRNWLLALVLAVFAAFNIALVYFIPTTEGSAGGLLVLAACVGAVGLSYLAIGLVAGKATLVERIQRPIAATGLDIIATMLGAFGLATAFAPPLLF